MAYSLASKSEREKAERRAAIARALITLGSSASWADRLQIIRGKFGDKGVSIPSLTRTWYSHSSAIRCGQTGNRKMKPIHLELMVSGSGSLLPRKSERPAEATASLSECHPLQKGIMQHEGHNTDNRASVYSRLDWAIRHVAATAGLGVARGPAGIGKTFCMEQVAQRLKREGIKVVMTSCPQSTEGNTQAVVKFVLSERGFHQRGTIERLEAFENLIMGNPYGCPPRPSVFLVDECQGARASLLTIFRQLWDFGDRVRLTKEAAPAFGMLLCGNHTFLNRRGRVSEMDIHSLRDHFTINVKLMTPGKAELREIAGKMCANDGAAKVIGKFGCDNGNVRSMAKVFREAAVLAEGMTVTSEHIRDAISMIEGCDNKHPFRQPKQCHC